MQKLTMTTMVLCLASGLAGADVVAVKGTATGYYTAPTPYMIPLGYNVHPGGYFRFSYTYDTDQMWPSIGSFLLESLDDAGNVLDTIDLKPTDVYAHENAKSGGYHIDEYFAWAFGQRNGAGFGATVLLVDPDGGRLPGDPATYLNQTWPRMLLGINVKHPDCEPYSCYGFEAFITSMSATVTPEIVDADGDGVPDSLDQCAGTSGGVVNSDGCNLDQLVPCFGPRSGGAWKNHGQYISAFTKAAEVFVSNGLLTEEQKDALVAAAAGSSCGK